MTFSESFNSNTYSSTQREENSLILISTGLLVLAAAAFLISLILSVI